MKFLLLNSKFYVHCSFIILFLHNMLYKMNFHITGYMYVMEHSAIVLVKMKFKDISFFYLGKKGNTLLSKYYTVYASL